LPGGIARPFRGTAQRKQSGVNDGRQAASAVGVQPLDGENAVIRLGNSKTAHTLPLYTLAFGQAQRAGPDQRAGPEASGIKAEWPRFGTKRGAQPASPTAQRRDALFSGEN